MSKRMLADVLWEAANVRLAPSFAEKYRRIDRYSCYAAVNAAGDPLSCVLDHINASATMNFLRELGCDFNATGWGDLVDQLSERQLQGVRYMWLLLAMHVAEDEGIAL